MKPRKIRLVILVPLVCLLSTINILAQTNAFSLIVNEKASDTELATIPVFFKWQDAVTRSRTIDLHPNIKSSNSIKPGDLIHLNLFKGADYSAVVERVTEMMEDNITIAAKLQHYDFAFIHISTTGGRTFAVIDIPETDALYQVLSDAGTQMHYLLELDAKKIPAPEMSPPVIDTEYTDEDIKEELRIQQIVEKSGLSEEDPATIDVMIVYTPAARVWADTAGGGIRNRVAIAMAKSQTALDNSMTGVTLRLVHHAEIGYREYGRNSRDLYRLRRTSNSYMTEVHEWRDYYGADLVQLFTDSSGGIGYLLMRKGGRPTHGFSISAVERTDGLVPIHEMGHNMGCHHHKRQNYQRGPTPWINWFGNNWSAGWRWKGDDDKYYCSVMSYTDGKYFRDSIDHTRVPYFSSPLLTYQGQPTGHPDDGDNARTIRGIKHVIAAYRATTNNICIEFPSYDFVIKPGTGWIFHHGMIRGNTCKVYRVPVSWGHTYNFQTGCVEGAMADFNTRLELYDEDFQLIDSDDHSCAFFRSKLSWVSNYSGNAYLIIRRSETESTGYYSLAFKETPGGEITWTGNVSDNWHDPANWDPNIVPDARFDVIIPKRHSTEQRYPHILRSDAEGKSLTIEKDAFLSIAGHHLIVSRHLNIHGRLRMLREGGSLTIHGDVNWHDHSSAEVNSQVPIRVYGHWTFHEGSSVQLNNGTVMFMGRNPSFINNHSAHSSFHSLGSYKVNGAYAAIGARSTQTLRIDGDLYVHPEAGLHFFSDLDISISGNISSSGTFSCLRGKVILRGDTQYLRLHEGNFFNNLTFNQGGMAYINPGSATLTVHGHVEIRSGLFHMQDGTLHVGGNWNNHAGDDAFNPGTGRVVFNGSGNQHIYTDARFNILETSMGGNLMIGSRLSGGKGPLVTCQRYHWTMGGIEVLNGTFTARDLAHMAIFGSYKVHPSGTINLHQGTTPLESVDLNCSMEFVNGGTINVFGGAGTSRWPLAEATLIMNEGVLDFKDQGINIRQTGTLHTNITGGVIRTSKGFVCTRHDFAPVDGTIELYGSSHSNVSVTAGSLPSLSINKTSKSALGQPPSGDNDLYQKEAIHTQEEPMWRVVVDDDLDIVNHLFITEGDFFVGSNMIKVGGNLDVYGNVVMNHPDGGFQVYGNVRWHPGSTADFSAYTVFRVHGNWSFLDGSNARLANGFVQFWGETNSFITSHSATSNFFNIGSYKREGAASIISSTSNQPLTINNDIYVHTGAIFLIQSPRDVIVNREINSNGSFRCTNGRVVLNGTDQYLKMNVGDYFNDLSFSQSGRTIIDPGFSNILKVNRHLIISSGVFELFDNTIQVGGNWTNTAGASAFVAGTGRVVFNGGGFQHIHSSENFHILEVNKTGFLRINNPEHAVSCRHYDWQGGGIEVLAGSFTASDLIQNGLFGKYVVHRGGVINITNEEPGTFVDLVGELQVVGGTINLAGTEAWWPAANGARLVMTRGIIDFKTSGLYIPSGYSWTNEITGGNIRTPFGFSGNDSNFNPSGGTMEFYGPGNAFIMQTAGKLHHIKIDKAAKSGDQALFTGPAIDSRSGLKLGSGETAGELFLMSDLRIGGNLDLRTGYLNASERTIYIGGNWTNHQWPIGFHSYGSRVVFNGTANQNCSSETFHTLEMNKPGGVLFIPQETDCVVYDWKSGGINVNGGMFTAHDLAQTNIRGNYSVNSGGTINLYQDASHWVDLNGSIYINSGTMNVYGGEPGSDSWWPDEAATLFMSGGVLDFKDQGIFIRNTGTFSSLITGGTIRTSKGYRGEREGFNPPAGTFEFYGPEDATISQTNGSSLHHVVIDKSGGDGSKSEVFTKRDGTKSSTAMTNKVIATSNLSFTNGLRVDNGSFTLNGHDLSVDGNVVVNAGGTLLVDAYASLLIGNHKRLLINDNGLLAVIGSKGADARISHISEGKYQFEIERGGTIAASQAIFEHINANGIVVKPGAIIDAQHAFNSCTFRNGAPGGRLLTLNNNQVFTIFGAHFPENTWGGSHNAYKAVQNGHVTFEGYTGLFSGSKHEYDPYDRISWGETGHAVEPLSQHVTSEAGTAFFEIITDLAWTASTKQTWVTISPLSGKGSSILTVAYARNDGKDPRTANIAIAFTGAPDIILTLTQDGTIVHYGSMETDQDTVSETHVFEPNETEQVIIITNTGQGDLAYEIDVEFDDPEKATAFRWLLINPAAGTIKPGQSFPITITFNSEVLQHADKSPAFGIYRARLLIFGNNPHKPQPEKVVKVTFAFDEKPDVPYLMAHPQSVIVGPSSGSISIEIYSNIPNFTITEDIPWILISRLTGNSLLTVTYSENSTIFQRSGKIILAAESVPDFEIQLTQEGATPYLSVSPATIDVEAGGGTTTIELASNASWEVINTVPWIGVLPVIETGNASLSLVIDENLEVTERLGTITVASDHAPDAIITINQQGAEPILSILPNLQYVSADAGIALVDLKANITWSITESSDWLEIYPLGGTGYEPIKIIYGENPTTNQRRGKISVAGEEGASSNAYIIQEGLEPMLVIEPLIHDVFAPAGTLTFDLQSNTVWTVTEEVPWLHVYPAGGSIAASLTVEYDANPFTEARKGEITVTAPDLPEQVIAVRQAGLTPILYIEPMARETGPETTTVTFFVQSNTDWTITEEIPWLTIYPTAGFGIGTVTVTVEENMSIIPRTGAFSVHFGGTNALVATVSQLGATPYLNAAPNGLNANWPGALYTANIGSNTGWQATSTADWLVIEPMIGHGSTLLIIDTETNHTGSPRQGMINISSEGLPDATIQIYQDHERIFLGNLEVDQHALNEVHHDNPTVTEQTIILSNTGTGELEFEIMVYFEMEPAEKLQNRPSTDHSGKHYKSPDPRNDENWLYVSNWGGMIEAGGHIPITVFFDSEKLIQDDKEIPFGTYYAQLEILDENDDSEDEALTVEVVLRFETDPTSAGEALKETVQLSRIYPTITRDHFTLELSMAGIDHDAIVSLFGTKGELIKHLTGVAAGKHTMDISGRQPGVYIVRVVMNDRVEVWRVIKQ